MCMFLSIALDTSSDFSWAPEISRSHKSMTEHLGKGGSGGSLSTLVRLGRTMSKS